MMIPTAFLYDPIFLEHDPGPGMPERIERIEAILDGLEAAGLRERLLGIDPRPATRQELELVHAGPYIDSVEQDIRSRRSVLSSDPTGADTRLSAKSLDAALMAAGAVVTAVDSVLAGKTSHAFCCVRPPGHHATAHAGMGFCIFNNIAVGARYAQRHRNIERVLIVDWDVHHGNGTQDIFDEDPSVFYASSHQSVSPLTGGRFYPGTGSVQDTGSGRAKGTKLNLPFRPFTTEEEFLGVWRARLDPAMEQFRPQLVFISAGFDAHEDDPLGSLRMSAGGFAQMTRYLMEISQRYAAGRVISALEGGYNLAALADSVVAHLRALLGDPLD